MLPPLTLVPLVAELCGAAFLACGVFPTALFASFLGDDGSGPVIALLLLSLSIFGVVFAFLAREELLAFGLGGAA